MVVFEKEALTISCPEMQTVHGIHFITVCGWTFGSLVVHAFCVNKVKVLYVRNLTSDVTEEQLKEKFGAFGKVERVKKIKDYGFVHFEEREDAVKAMEALNGDVSTWPKLEYGTKKYKILKCHHHSASSSQQLLLCWPFLHCVQ